MANLPKFIQGHPTWHEHWEKPWTVSPDPKKAAQFKKLLWEHGYISPNFTRAEGKSSDGKPIPEAHRGHAQRYCFVLERVRHELGRPLGWIDLYRSPEHNAAVGGATSSEHVWACAADWGPQPDQARFNDRMRHHYFKGGIGSGAVSNRVMHTDTGCRNGGPRRWTYPGS